MVIFCFSCSPPLRKFQILCVGGSRASQPRHDLTFHSFSITVHTSYWLIKLNALIFVGDLMLSCFQTQAWEVLLHRIIVPICTSTVPPFFKAQIKCYFNPLDRYNLPSPLNCYKTILVLECLLYYILSSFMQLKSISVFLYPKYLV